MMMLYCPKCEKSDLRPMWARITALPVVDRGRVAGFVFEYRHKPCRTRTAFTKRTVHLADAEAQRWGKQHAAERAGV